MSINWNEMEENIVWKLEENEILPARQFLKDSPAELSAAFNQTVGKIDVFLSNYLIFVFIFSLYCSKIK
jgi:hypothetical protein